MATIQRKKSAKRLFTGIAGSPLAVIREIPPAPSKRVFILGSDDVTGRLFVSTAMSRPGRPRKFKSNADRQYAYNKRKRAAAKAEEYKTLPVGPLTNGKPASNSVRHVGYDPKKLVEISDASIRDGVELEVNIESDGIIDVKPVVAGCGGGRKVQPKGNGAGRITGREAAARDDDTGKANTWETDDTFVKKQEKHFDEQSKPLIKELFKESVKRLFCAAHSLVAENTAGAYADNGTWVLLYEAAPDEQGSHWAMTCGCTIKVENVREHSVKKRHRIASHGKNCGCRECRRKWLIS